MIKSTFELLNDQDEVEGTLSIVLNGGGYTTILTLSTPDQRVSERRFDKLLNSVLTITGLRARQRQL